MTNNVQIRVIGKGGEPGQLDVDIVVGVVLLELDTQGTRSLGGADPEEDVREPTDEPETRGSIGSSVNAPSASGRSSRIRPASVRLSNERIRVR